MENTALYIDGLCEFLRQETADLRFKVPTASDDGEGSEEYTLSAPKVYMGCYGQIEDMSQNVPSILVTLNKVTDETDSRSYGLTLTLAIYSSGNHSQDIYTPVSGSAGAFVKGGKDTSVFALSPKDTWFDIYNFTDKVIGALRKSKYELTGSLEVQFNDTPEVLYSGFRLCDIEFTVMEQKQERQGKDVPVSGGVASGGNVVADIEDEETINRFLYS